MERWRKPADIPKAAQRRRTPKRCRASIPSVLLPLLVPKVSEALWERAPLHGNSVSSSATWLTKNRTLPVTQSRWEKRSFPPKAAFPKRFANFGNEKGKFEATLDFEEVPSGLKGQYNQAIDGTHKIDVYALHNAGTQESTATFVHEARHAVMTERGINQATQFQEYMARAREYLFKYGVRPNAAARAAIRQEVQELYSNLPLR